MSFGADFTGLGRLEQVDTLRSRESRFRGSDADSALQAYGAWRRCQPDGNCFYRAFGFALVEGIVRRKPQRLRNVREVINKSSNRQVEALLELLKSLERLEPQEAVEQWYRGIIPDGEMDGLLVRAIRLAAAYFLAQNSEVEIEGLPISVLCESAAGMSVDMFIQNAILANGSEADNIHIQIVATAFGRVIKVVQPDQRWEVSTLPSEMNEETIKTAATLIMWQGQHATAEFGILYSNEPERGELPWQHLFQIDQQIDFQSGQAASSSNAGPGARRRRDKNDFEHNPGSGLARQDRAMSSSEGQPFAYAMEGDPYQGSIDALRSSLTQAVRTTEKATSQQQRLIEAEYEKIAQARQDLQAKQRDLSYLENLLEEKRERMLKETEEVEQLAARLERLKTGGGGLFQSLCKCCT